MTTTQPDQPDFRGMPASQITVDMLIPEWTPAPGATGRTNREREAKAVNTRARDALQVVLNRLRVAEHSEEGWSDLKRLVREQGHQLAEAEQTEQELRDEITKLTRLRDLIPAIIVAVGTVCAWARTEPEAARVTEEYVADDYDEDTVPVIKFRVGSVYVTYNPMNGTTEFELDDIEPGDGDMQLRASEEGEFSRGQQRAIGVFFDDLRDNPIPNVMMCFSLSCERCRRLRRMLEEIIRPNGSWAEVTRVLRSFARDGVHQDTNDSGWLTFSER